MALRANEGNTPQTPQSTHRLQLITRAHVSITRTHVYNSVVVLAHKAHTALLEP